MTYEERQRYRELRDQLEALRQELSEADPSEPLTRAEAVRLLSLIEAALDGVSPDRWDHLMEVVASEVMRRVGGMPTPL